MKAREKVHTMVVFNRSSNSFGRSVAGALLSGNDGFFSGLGKRDFKVAAKSNAGLPPQMRIAKLPPLVPPWVYCQKKPAPIRDTLQLFTGLKRLHLEVCQHVFASHREYPKESILKTGKKFSCASKQVVFYLKRVRCQDSP